MKDPRTTTRRSARSGAAPVPDRAPEKHEEARPLSVAELAYRLYEERGRQDGHQLEDWIEAERRVSGTKRTGDAAKRGSTTATGTEERDDRQDRQTADKQAR